MELWLFRISSWPKSEWRDPQDVTRSARIICVVLIVTSLSQISNNLTSGVVHSFEAY